MASSVSRGRVVVDRRGLHDDPHRAAVAVQRGADRLAVALDDERLDSRQGTVGALPRLPRRAMGGDPLVCTVGLGRAPRRGPGRVQRPDDQLPHPFEAELLV